MAKQKYNSSLWIMLAAIAAIVVLLFFLPSCGSNGADQTTLVKTGQEAPDFTVEMTDGSQTTLSNLRGQVVLLNFWATWCPPCRAELQRVQTEIIDRFAGREFVFLPISRGEDERTVEEFRLRSGFTFPMGLDPAQTAYDLYAANYIPRNFLIDKEGRIVKITVGYTPEEFDELVLEIDNELNKQ